MTVLAGEDILTIIVRTIFYYTVIVIIFRMMGKREIGELSLLDIVVYIMIAELAVVTIEDLEIEYWFTLIPMAILLIIQRLTAFISLKSPLFRTYFEGKPSIIITNGKIDEHEMKKNRYNFTDLLQQLRENGTESINDVEFAILEPSGKLSVIEKKDDDKSVYPMSGLVLPLIVDGKIQQDALKNIQRDEKWLRKILKEKGFPDFNEISFCSIDRNNEWYIDKKNEKK
ncbi:uncharacterized membrane protein YcaP (DUF421 family) [Gracilibacillus halotolerans]|uniref:Uncharacterized membrane protein YcaP (DUF421 family) n=1 Tax=Gracilibacillus halotolerans TaxID=74386 RepID=A0A841RL47_9BACI|nr:uncharacterized membrane protein YcaP (DUF421 family) [Gracilibacillus halotolerans]